MNKLKEGLNKVKERTGELTSKIFGQDDKKKKTVKILLIVFIALIIAVIVFGIAAKKNKTKAESDEVKTTEVIRGNLTSEISSSGTIEAKSTYNITSLATGKIIEADFEEGDIVKEGQVLYRIDSTTADTELKNAKNSYERAQASYEDAEREYDEAVELYEGGIYRATREGYIKKLYIEAGDKVSGNTQLADIYSESSMKIKLPFIATDAVNIRSGNDAVLMLSDTLEQIMGKVISVSNMDEVIDGGRIVRYVTISIQNPGGLTKGMSASAAVGAFLSAESGTFEANVDTKMNSELTTGVEIKQILVHEGDYVKVGTPVFSMTDSSAEKLMRSFSDELDQASEKLDSAESKYNQAVENADNYTITAPVEGKIINKNYKAGDKITSSGGMASTLCQMYDMSEYTFEMSVDELDVLNVKEGLSVRIEADAFAGQSFTGKVTNVSLVSSSQNGVSTYPVTVTLDDTYELLPGMNVEGYIILGESDNTLMVSSDAIMRGNQVYIKDDSVKEKEGIVPAGFRAVEVETGLSNDDYVEIISGVEEGDVVYLPDTSSAAAFMMPGSFPGGNGGFPGGGSGGFSGGGNGGSFPNGGPSGGSRNGGSSGGRSSGEFPGGGMP